MKSVLLVGILVLSLGALIGCNDKASTPAGSQGGAGKAQPDSAAQGGAGASKGVGVRFPKAPQ
jgi:hypothetical protein